MAKIGEYWPEFLAQLREFGLVADTEDVELNDLRQEINNILNDQFIETATERGIARREAILNITPYGDDTIETRRFRVAGKWLNRLPYTYRMLQDRLDALLGPGKYVIELHKEPYTLRVLIELTVKRQFDAAQGMLREVVPANLRLIVELRYNQHITIGQLTHGALAAYRHIDIREEVLPV
ncbi:putative phage tail protein [Thermicanus aegyptius]|uniref:putative phage tail protein n=1 Tax=Thermicanus aegyptius TaxID=94009 RepID=UPI00048C2534|nr:putative phage tail protein [Thermicanus aegyptius]